MDRQPGDGEDVQQSNAHLPEREVEGVGGAVPQTGHGSDRRSIGVRGQRETQGNGLMDAGGFPDRLIGLEALLVPRSLLRGGAGPLPDPDIYMRAGLPGGKVSRFAPLGQDWPTHGGVVMVKVGVGQGL